MSTFKEHKTIADRAASDRSRHRKKVEKAIKESIKDVVSEESIIGQSGKKKIRIPIRGIREHQFVYGNNENNKRVGSAQGKEVKQGQRIGQRQPRPGDAPGSGNQPGNKPGEEMYEIEMSLEELAEYLFADLNLPELEKKRFKFITEEKMKRKGKRPYGIRPRLSKKETIKQKLRRKKSAIKAGTYDPDSGERFPFHEGDLRYKHMAPVQQENTTAVIFFVMDVSGSMDKSKKFLARSFFFLLYQFLNHRYSSVDVVFISHTTEANEVDENQFFTRATGGGTMASSALEKVKSVIDKRYHPNNWNIYTFYCGDGENWPSDNDKTIELIKELKEINQMICYTEIGENREERMNSLSFFSGYSKDSLWNRIGLMENPSLQKVRLVTHDDIWKSFKKLFGGKL
jgi:hypothetical protein